MIDSRVQELTASKNFAALTTITADGFPQTSVMWVDVDEDYVLINTEVERAKYKNIQKNPKVSVIIWDATNPYRYVEIRGEVASTDRSDNARRHIDQLSQKYHGTDYPGPIQSDRVILKIRPVRVRANGI